MNSTLELTDEEQFSWMIGEGWGKTKAYRALFDCSAMNDNLVQQKAWQYARNPNVVRLLQEDSDNSFMNHIKARNDMLGVLHALAVDGESEFVRQESANKFLTQTAKLAKQVIDVNVTAKSEMNDALLELRSILLAPKGETPQGVSPTVKKPPYNEIAQIETNPEGNLNQDALYKNIQEIETSEPPYKNLQNSQISETPIETSTEEGMVYLDDDIVDAELLEEQLEGINPRSVRKGVGEACKTTGSTGAFREGGTGKFISNEEAKRRLEEQIKASMAKPS